MQTMTATDPGLLVLISLATAPRHGHAMLLDIESFAGVRLGPGTLYGAIGRLDAEGLIEPTGTEGRRRPYRITPLGRDRLGQRLAGLNQAVQTGLRRMAVES